jgi:hypothetical protein
MKKEKIKTDAENYEKTNKENETLKKKISSW